ncbi:MAG TPA: MFS transporter, partial [Abditibacteriaceae bacterium]
MLSSEESKQSGPAAPVSSADMKLFWGCFIALITTSTAFITRAILINNPNLWPKDFGLDPVKAGELFGAGLWPFAISIILFSFFIDRIGYKAAMFFSAVCYVIYAVMVLQAYGKSPGEAWPLLYWGSVILGLGNGTVEAFINPVVATIFSRQKAKWLNIL